MPSSIQADFYHNVCLQCVCVCVCVCKEKESLNDVDKLETEHAETLTGLHIVK